MRLFIAGDTHGNTGFLSDYMFPTAKDLGASAIVQVGDFGFWEHELEGVEFLDDVGRLAREHDIPLYALHGNHDNWSLVMKRYGADRDALGFVRVREGLFYIPQGHVWRWSLKWFRSFGGAYSPNKFDLVAKEKAKQHLAQMLEDRMREDGMPPRPVPTFAGTQWFPDEEPTDTEFDALLAEFSDPVHVIFSHDKPRSSNPGIKLSPIPECGPNQDRLQRALRLHRPQLWFHGHLHHRYSDTVHNGPAGATQVIGLHCDPRGAHHSGRDRGYDKRDAWAVLDLGPDGQMSYRSSYDLIARQSLWGTANVPPRWSAL